MIKHDEWFTVENRAYPPDTMGSVGQYTILTVTNGGAAIHNKNTKSVINNYQSLNWENWLDSFNLTGFGLSVNAFDPKCFFDPYENRYVFIYLNNKRRANSTFALFVSKTETSEFSLSEENWYRTVVQPNINVEQGQEIIDLWCDFPNLGFSKDYVVITLNMFSVEGQTSLTDAYSHIIVYNKHKLYNGDFSDNKTTFIRQFNIIPQFTYGNLADDFFCIGNNQDTIDIGNVPYISYNYLIYKLNIIMNGDIISSVSIDTHPTVDNYTFRRDNLIQRTQANQLNGDDTTFGPGTRIFGVIFRNNKLWIVQQLHNTYNESFHWLKSSVFYTNIDPYNIVDNKSTILKRTVIEGSNSWMNSGNPLDLILPSISVNKNEDVLITYNMYNSSIYPSLGYSFKHNTDAEFRDITLYKNGNYINEYLTRAGDYSSTVIDPSNDIDFFSIGQTFLNQTNRNSLDWYKFTITEEELEEPQEQQTPQETIQNQEKNNTIRNLTVVILIFSIIIVVCLILYLLIY